MGPAENIYLRHMTQFAALLREEGLTVGPGETADACQLLAELELMDRSVTRDALRAVFAKSREEQSAFDRCFDAFFVSLDQRRASRERQRQEAQELLRRRAEAHEELTVNGREMDLRDDLRETYVRLPEDKRAYLQQMLEKTRVNLERNPQLYNNFIRTVFTKYLLEQQLLMEDAAVGCQDLDPDVALLYRDISQFRSGDIPKAAALIAGLTQQLTAQLSRRRQRMSLTGKLDFKRTIRRGLETGGSLYRLSFRQKRPRKRQLVVLCDVSGSMLQFSEFALRFLKAMAEVSDASRIFLFSEDLFEADPFALQNMDAFRGYVASSGLYGRGTDLGLALARLTEGKTPVLGPNVTLLVLSDTKTIDLPRALACLKEAKRQAGRVLWLNPIPQGKWPYVRSIQTVASLCQMLPCGTLHELAQACRKLTDSHL